MTSNSHRPEACAFRDDLKAYVDGELAALRRTAVARHLESCAACAEEVRTMRWIGGELKNMETAVEPPAELRQRILARLDFAPPTRRTLLFDVVRWGSLAGVMALMIFAIVSPILEPAREKSRYSNTALRSNPQQQTAAGGAAPTAATAAEPPSPQVPVASAPAASPQMMAKGDSFSAGERARRAAENEVSAFKPNREESFDEEWEVKRRQPASMSSGVTPEDVRRYTHGLEAQDFKRKVVQTADLAVRVNRGLEELQDSIAARLKKDGGYVESSSLSAAAAGERMLRMTLRVPVDHFDATLTYLAGFGEVTGKNVRGDDVTGTWIDQRAEVRELRKEEARLLKEYEAEKNPARQQQIRWQLLAIRPRIAASEERFALTSKLAALSTVHLVLTEEPQARVRGNLMQDLENSARSAVAAFLIALRVPAAAVIWLLVFSPLWVPCIALYRWASRMSRAHRSPPPSAPGAQPAQPAPTAAAH